MIAVLSLNTAVDRILAVRGFHVGTVQRAQRAEAYAGGKGLNVARVLRQLGRPARVIGFLGGTAAPFVRERCGELGIEQRWIDIAGESRTCVIVVDEEAGTTTVVNENGPEMAPGELAWLREELEYYTLEGDILCISGSAPPGVPEGFYAEVVHAARDRGVRVLVDASGVPLRLAAEANPWALAPNIHEAEAAFGATPSPEAMARRLAAHASHVLLKLGADGLMYAANGDVTHLHPPAVRAINPIASGDALAAGFLAGIEEGMQPLDAARLGVACGAANAARFAPGIRSREEVTRLALVIP